jgi:Zn-dependent peptidase ImmA (M78 family)/transcriptional regulator with XRE-family HTH domain
MIYGDRIRQVRELKGWTQAELAEKLTVNQPFIAKLEGDRVAPQFQLVEKLSLVSGFPPTFFSREPESDFPAGSLLFRSHAVMTVKESAEMYRYAQVTFGLVKTMLTKKKFKPFPLNLPTGISDDPCEAAAVTRSELGISPDKPIQHLTNALEKAGILVLALPRPFEHREAFSLWAGFDRSRPVIVLAGGKVGDRLRMTMAHELGHLVMHKPIVNAVQEVEKQAFQFAAEFLMPAKQMRLEIIPPVNLDTFTALKQRWGVAIQALIVRAKELEIVNQRKYTYLFQQLSARGWRMREPRMFDVPVEKPRAVRQIAEAVYGLPIRYKKLAEDVGMPEEFVKSIIEAHATKVPDPPVQTGFEKGNERTKGAILPFGRTKVLVS